jgi:hypothetical protein
MLKMNYSDFKGKNYHQLVKECERRGINTFDCRGLSMSADDLVGKIIAHDAYYEGRNDALNGRSPKAETKPARTRYRFLEVDGTEHYVMLTPEQERFMRWNHDNCVNYDNMDIDVIENIEWETP